MRQFMRALPVGNATMLVLEHVLYMTIALGVRKQ